MIERSARDINKYTGAIVGLAVGDALGFPVEFLNKSEIHETYGKQGITHFEPSYYGRTHFDRGTVTDDTQQTVSVANALLQTEQYDVNEFMKNLSQELVSWYNSPENNRAPGPTSMRGIANLINGAHWSESGIKGSKSCGSAMRSAPIGLVFYDNPERIREIAFNSSSITHDSDVARAAAAANAYLVARGINEESQRSKDVITGLEEFTRGMSQEFSDKLEDLPYLLTQPSDYAMKEIGEAWNGHEAVVGGLYCALKTNFNYQNAIIMGANIDGDSDSVASIAGGIVGAHTGFASIPIMYTRKLEGSRNLIDLSTQLFRKEFE
jgi:ADP-ribosylglycohydrolase